MWGAVISWADVVAVIIWAYVGGSDNVGLCGGTVIRWANVGGSVKVALCGGQ